MDLLPSDEQNEIVATVTAQLERDFDLNRLAALDGEASVIDRDLWRRCAELGWFGLGLDESLGGVGYTLAEETLLFGELGRYATPGPFLATVLGARLAATTGAGDLAAQILGGETIVVLAEPHGDADATVGATSSGTFRVTDHGSADLVLAIAGGSAALIDAERLPLEPFDSLDRLVPVATVRLDATPAVAHLDDATDLVLRGTVLVAAELAGMARATTDQSTQYGHDRLQFGVPIGSFQAVKHRCADMAVRAEAAECAVRYAALALVDGLPSAAFHVEVARTIADDAAVTNSQVNVQNHGGIGFTLEHTAHRYVTRAQLRSRTLGTHFDHLASLLAEPAPA